MKVRPNLLKSKKFEKPMITRYYVEHRLDPIHPNGFEVFLQFKTVNNEWTRSKRIRLSVIESNKGSSDVLFLGYNAIRKINPIVRKEGETMFGMMPDIQKEKFEMKVTNWVNFRITANESVNTLGEFLIHQEMVKYLFNTSRKFHGRESNWRPKYLPMATEYMLNHLSNYRFEK